MPNLWVIANYWAARDVFEVDLEVPHCFGCQGRCRARPTCSRKDAWVHSGLHRSHLVDRVLDGLDGAQNLVSLCWRCNLTMPSFGCNDGPQAIAWVWNGGNYPVESEAVMQVLTDDIAGRITREQCIARIARAARVEVPVVVGWFEQHDILEAQRAACR